jgi:hypothetical protein
MVKRWAILIEICHFVQLKYTYLKNMYTNTRGFIVIHTTINRVSKGQMATGKGSKNKK